MSKRDPFISRFSPNRTDPEKLEQIHVERDDLLEDAVARVRASILGKKRKHLLFVGQRGSGKTHLLSLLVHRLRADGEAIDKVRIAWLNEDETSLSYTELLARVYRALVAAYPEEFTEDALAKAFELGVDGGRQYLEDLLAEQVGERRLLVLLENFDALLDALGEEGQRQWRAFLQDSRLMVVVATAQRMTQGMSKVNRKKGNPEEKLADEEKTFFGFFTVTAMSPFAVDEAAQLLKKLARLKGDPELVEFLDSRRGRARVRALRYLSGGNPRLYIVLSEFITKESFDELVRPFEEMVDERLTPYYQERLRWLSPQQRRLVEVLCQSREAMTVGVLAREVFAAENTVSGQLKKLREMGYVDATKGGRESYYELREPLMRLSMQVKGARGEEPLGLLVDFLKVWFEREELEERLEGGGVGELGRRYLLPAVESLREEGPVLRYSLLRRGVDGVDVASCSDEERARLYDLAEETGEAGDLINAGLAAGHAGALQVADGYLTRVVEQEGVSAEEVAWALFNRGVARWRQGDAEGEMADYGRVVELEGAPAEQVAKALVNRGVARGRQGDPEGEMADYDRVVELEGAPAEQVAKALINRGVARGEQGDVEGEMADYSWVVELEGAPAEQVAKALHNRGVVRGRRGDAEGEMADYGRVVELEGAPAEQVAKALVNRGVVRGQQGDTEGEMADYDLVMELEGASADQVVFALYNRGVAREEQGDVEGAMADYGRVVELEGAPVGSVAKARGRMWRVFRVSEKIDEARKLCREVLEKDQIVPDWVADELLTEVLSGGQGSESWQGKVGELYERFAGHGHLDKLGEGLVRQLGTLEEGHLNAKGLEDWVGVWEDAAGDNEAMVVGLRLLRAGVNYLKEGQRRELLRLPKEERALVMQALELEDEG